MINQLGFAIARVAQNTPGGILVFFASFKFLYKVYNIWLKKEYGIYDRIETHKRIFIKSKTEDI